MRDLCGNYAGKSAMSEFANKVGGKLPWDKGGPPIAVFLAKQTKEALADVFGPFVAGMRVVEREHNFAVRGGAFALARASFLKFDD